MRKTLTTRYLILPLLGVAALFAGCSKSEMVSVAPSAAVASQNVTAPGFPEGFETGTKTAYTTGSVVLGSGSWTLNDALIGNTTSDPHTGLWSARVRNSGLLSMDFDLTGGAGVVTVDHGKYGVDANSTWELWASSNSGSTYAKVGSTITSSSTVLSTASFTVNIAGTVRLQVRKTDATTSRVNFDNITVQSYASGGGTGGKKFLFDASHAETASNADWVLDVDAGVVPRYPTPAASGITSTTPETYWTAALSSWGVALVKLGNSVENLPSGTAITYGNVSNPQDLANYNVFVVDEPNTLFNATEKAAIINFVKNGGGLFMISDHNISDRNNDGYDSPAIWNDLMTNNGIQANPFGFSIDLTNISETTSNILASSTNTILHGTQGNVTQLKYSNGATISKTSGSAAVPLIWQGAAAQGNTNIMCASSTYGTGRVVVIADSSPADDGTGSPGNTVYPGWTELASHANLHMNASLWLAKQQ